MRMYFSLDIDPVPKGRPRLGRYGAYTPQKTRDAEEEIQTLLMSSPRKPVQPTKSPVIVSLKFSVPMPKSWSKRKRRAFNESVHISKPDLDNLCKLVTDAMNGIIYVDDSQISDLFASKEWGEKGKIIIQITEHDYVH